MHNVVLECKSCGSILVVNPKDLWHNIRCTKCDSPNVVNLDDIFGQTEIVDEENKIITSEE